MKKAKKHYKDRNQILQAIDDETHNLKMAIKLGADYDLEADRIVNWLNLNPLDEDSSEGHRTTWHGNRRRMVECREEAGVKHRAVPRHQTALLKLKQVLAEFDTEPMPFLGTDTGVRIK